MASGWSEQTSTSLSIGWSRSPSSLAGTWWNAAATQAARHGGLHRLAATDPRGGTSGWNSLPTLARAFAIEITTLPCGARPDGRRRSAWRRPTAWRSRPRRRRPRPRCRRRSIARRAVGPRARASLSTASMARYFEREPTTTSKPTDASRAGQRRSGRTGRAQHPDAHRASVSPNDAQTAHGATGTAELLQRSSGLATRGLVARPCWPTTAAVHLVVAVVERRRCGSPPPARRRRRNPRRGQALGVRHRLRRAQGQLPLDHGQHVDGHPGVEPDPPVGRRASTSPLEELPHRFEQLGGGGPSRATPRLGCRGGGVAGRRAAAQQVVLVLAHPPADGGQLDRPVTARAGGPWPGACR